MYHIEITDTYGGDANYCWVTRGTTKSNSRAGKIAAVKRLAGWQGIRINVEDLGDMMVIRPCKTERLCQIAFVTWRDGDQDGEV